MLTKDDLIEAAENAGGQVLDGSAAVDAVLDALIEKMESVHGREELRQIRGEESR